MYLNNLHYLEQKFCAEVIVVFVIDIYRWSFDRFVQKNKPMSDFLWFTNYKTFLDTEYGDQ